MDQIILNSLFYDQTATLTDAIVFQSRKVIADVQRQI